VLKPSGTTNPVWGYLSGLTAAAILGGGTLVTSATPAFVLLFASLLLAERITLRRLLALGIISTALAMYLWNTAFGMLDAGVVCLTFFAQPVAWTLPSVLILNEHISPLFIFGGILFGIDLLVSSKA
jgi:drug/metabolite transporter (DMT)-like permease